MPNPYKKGTARARLWAKQEARKKAKTKPRPKAGKKPETTPGYFGKTKRRQSKG